MGCSCKGSTGKQVTSVKQVIKKSTTNKTTNSSPEKKVVTKKILFRRHM